MSIKAYEEYKDSGVEWLGQVPAHWGILKIKNICSMQSGEFISPDSITTNDKYPVYGGNGLRGYTSNHTHTGIYPLIGRQGALCGNINYARDKFWASEHAIVVNPSNFISPKWLGELLRSMDLNQYSITAAQPGLSVDKIKNLCIPKPPYLEQRNIAAFLDHETARIDALIEEQQRLITLLKEKRQAVISHAVTKGLDPNVPMKDSGVEWLGDVPAHWEVIKLGYICRLQGGYAFSSSCFSQDGVTLVKMNNLKRGKLDLERAIKISPDECDSKFELVEGDILYGMSGSIGETGSLGNYAIVDLEDLPAQLNQRVGRFLLSRKILSNYLELIIQSSSFNEQVLDQVTGTAQFNISSDQVESCKVAFPRIEEQKVITQKTQARLNKMIRLMDLANNQIHYLQERRSALISAAVTGKIDVRDWQPPKASQTASEPAEASA